MEQILLVQKGVHPSTCGRIIDDDRLWQGCLRNACRLRQRVFFSRHFSAAGENAAATHEFESDRFDPHVSHVLAIGDEGVVGTIRIHGGCHPQVKEGFAAQQILRELSLPGYEEALNKWLDTLHCQKRRVAEISRLAVNDAYRKKSHVCLSIIVSALLLTRQNSVDDYLITSARKDGASHFYAKLGFRALIDPHTQKAFDPFYYQKFHDYSELMHCPAEVAHENLAKCIGRFEYLYQQALVIRKAH